jgi:hypothetical protein
LAKQAYYYHHHHHHHHHHLISTLNLKLAICLKVYSDGTVKYTLDGPLFFGSSHKFSTFFDASKDATSKGARAVVVDMANVRLLDGSV